MWAKEEMYSEGYTKATKYPPKYATKWARKNHFKGELKFAMQKAETKAHEKTIRELAGLMTGYKAADLSEGRLIFAKVLRSREMLQAESAARLTAMSQGIEPSKDTQALLFGETPQDMPVSGETVDPIVDPIIPAEPVAAYTLPESQRLINAIEKYNAAGLISAADSATAEGIIRWVESKGPDAVNDDMYWPKAIGILKQIESGIKPELLEAHDLY